MVLNYIWLGLILVAFVAAVVRAFSGDVAVFEEMMSAAMSAATTSFRLSLGLTGVLAFWLGMLRIAERGGIVVWLSRVLSPLFSCLFPSLPRGHPAFGTMFMNVASNMLGLDNAATPMGLKAMAQLQESNDDKTRASDAMIMFLVLNTSGLTILPVSIMVYRSQLGAASAADIVLPLLLTTSFSTLVGVAATALWQRHNLFRRPLVVALLVFCAALAAVVVLFSRGDRTTLGLWTSAVANGLLLAVVVSFLIIGIVQRVNVYAAFIEGAKEGFVTAVRIIPYLLAILVAVALFRAAGAMDYLLQMIEQVVVAAGGSSDITAALPTALLKPLSGSGARGMMIDAMTTYGADSFTGRLACLFQGSTDTTFYILALYFGSVGITRTRHAVVCGLLADAAAIAGAIVVARLFYG